MENKFQESTIAIVALLLAAVVFLAANVCGDYAPLVNQSLILSETSSLGVTMEVSVPASVVINELMADNEAAVESPFGTYPDWIELFNTGNQSVDLSGMYLADSLDGPTWQFPEGTIIEPNSFLLIWADGDPELGSLHTDFKLNANGETVALFADDGTSLIDSVQFEKQIRDVSYGRSPDGSQSWMYLTRPTAGESNFANSRSNPSTAWQLWLLIILALTACILIVLKDRIQTRRVK